MVEAVLAEAVALIGGEDDEGVFQLARGLERGHQPAHAFVDSDHALIHLLHPFVVGFSGHERIIVAGLAVLLGHDDGAVGAARPRLRFFEIGGFVGPRAGDVGGRSRAFAGERAAMAVGRCGGAMNRAIAEPEIPRLRGIAVGALDVVDGPAGVVVGGVAGRGAIDAVEGEELIGVIVAGVFRMAGSVPDDLVIPVAAEAGVGAGVPLADLRRVVALLPKLRGHERTLRGIVTAPGVGALHRHALDAVLEPAGEQRRARWHAPRAEVAALETHALRGQAVDVRRLHPRRAGAVTAQCFVGLVVGENEKDVRSRDVGGAEHGEGREGRKRHDGQQRHAEKVWFHG